MASGIIQPQNTAMEITTTTDLNTLVPNDGKRTYEYYCNRRDLVTNFPSTSIAANFPFRLFVFKLDPPLLYAVQVYVSYGTYTKIYIRQQYHNGSNVVWSDWRRIGYNQTEILDIVYPVVTATIQRSGTNSYITYKRRGNTVTVYIYHKVSTGTISAWGSILMGTLPTGSRPPCSVVTRCVTDRASSSGCQAYITTGGNVYIEGRYSGATDTGDILTATITFTT